MSLVKFFHKINILQIAIYQELIKVRYMRPLETLHNNLCFKSLNTFLTRMIYDRHSPNEITASLLKSKSSNNLSNNADKLEINANEQAKKELKVVAQV